MTIYRETVSNRYSAANTDIKPTGVPVGTTVWEYDTKNTYKTYDGTNYSLYKSGTGSGSALLTGDCSVSMTDSTVTIVVPGLAGFGNDFFNDKFFMQVVYNASVPGNIPEREVRQITDYVSSTGTFTVNAFSSNVSALDKVLILHESLAYLAGPTASINKSIGKLQIATTTEGLNQVAGAYALFVGTTQKVVLEKLNLKMPTGAAGGSVTSVSVVTDDATAQTIISVATGDIANLTSEADLGWTGSVIVNVGTKINLVIAGGAHGSAYDITAIAQCRAVIGGGKLLESVAASESPSDSPSDSPSVSPSDSPSASPSDSPSLSPSASDSPSDSPSLSPSASNSPSDSPSNSPSISPSDSPSTSPSATDSPSDSPSTSPSATDSPSDSPSATPSPSVSPSDSPSTSPSATDSPSDSPSTSPSATDSPSASPSNSPSGSPSDSPSGSPSDSPSDSPSVSPSESPSENPA